MPTPELGDPPYSKEQLGRLESGINNLTRDEIISEFGAPTSRYANNRVLIYAWTMKQGIWIYGVATAGGAEFGESKHSLCLRFDTAGSLADLKHIDSAISSTESMVNALLNEWIGEISLESGDSGYTPLIDVDVFEARDRPSIPAMNNILTLDGSERPFPCRKALERMAHPHFEIHDIRELRDLFYPWLEHPFTDHLTQLADSSLLAKQRQETGLRFLVVSRPRQTEELCALDSEYGIACYRIQGPDSTQFLAVLDLRKQHDTPTERRKPVEPIPIFASNKREACNALMAYAVRDIELAVRD